MLFKTIIISIGVIFLTVGCSLEKNKTGKALISAEELIKLSKNDKDIKIIDLRTPEEVKETGVIPGAISNNFLSEEFESSLKSLDKEKTYVVYCKAGGRSSKAAKKMKMMGLKVSDYTGGMDGWLSKQNKTIRLIE